MTESHYDQLREIDRQAEYHWQQLQRLLQQGFKLVVANVDGMTERERCIDECRCSEMRAKLMGQRLFHYCARRKSHSTSVDVEWVI